MPRSPRWRPTWERRPNAEPSAAGGQRDRSIAAGDPKGEQRESAGGARVGEPDAPQVADRYHLWQNLGKAVERCAARHRSCLRTPEPDSTEPAGPGPIDRPTKEQSEEPSGKFADRARRHHALVHELLGQGHSLRGIARQLGWRRHTVQRYARAATWQEMVDGKWKIERGSKLNAFKSHLRQRCEQGYTDATRLYHEVTDRGFHGSYSTVSDCVAQYRTNPAPITAPPPTVRQVTGWLTRRPDSLPQNERLHLTDILERCPELRAAHQHVRAFGEMLTGLQGHNLPAWIAAIQDDNLPDLTSFATGLLSDLDAVTAGLTTRWNSGPVEGRVNHVKTLKRQMFGRAGLPLLRKHVCSPPLKVRGRDHPEMWARSQDSLLRPLPTNTGRRFL